MKMPLFVERLSPDNDVIERIKINHLPASIGRAYDNDIILIDEFVAPHHARLTLNQLNELIVEDCGSHNGIVKNNQRHTFFVIDGDSQFRFGHTQLRFRTSDYAVAPERQDTSNHSFEGWKPAFWGCALLIVAAFFSQWLVDFTNSAPSTYLTEITQLLITAVGWSGLWAFAGKLLNGRSRFGRQLWVTTLSLTAISVWEIASDILGFSLNLPLLTRFSVIPLVIICTIGIYYHLTLLGIKNPPRARWVVAVLAMISIGFTLTRNYQESRHFTDDLYMSSLQPPAFRLTSDESKDAFMSSLDDLKTGADTARKTVSTPTQ